MSKRIGSGHGGCWKKTYSKKSHAVEIARKMRASSGSLSIKAYRCPRCGQFHVGHDKK